VLIASKFKCVPIEKPQNILKYSWRNWNEILIPDCNLKIWGIDVPLAETTEMNLIKNLWNIRIVITYRLY